MIKKSTLHKTRALLWVLLHLVSTLVSLHYQSVEVVSLSISSSSNINKLGSAGSSSSRHISNSNLQNVVSPMNNNNNNNNINMNLQPLLTTLSPVLTTNGQQSHLDSIGHQQMKHHQQQQQHSQDDLSQSASERSSDQQRILASNSGEEHDDTVPLATINNHSRNNQPAIRPPQYVDVSALVGRDRNPSNSGMNAPSGAQMSPSGASGSTVKSRSGLPECATQQVCNAIFVRMNYTQKLCECSSNYNWKCSNNLDPQDGHTIELTRKFDKRIYTQIKTCEPLREVRACKSPTDWTLLALQSERSGKAHYVVVCKCPTWAQLEGPYTHNHPPYANIPGIRVYGMLCAHQTARSSAQTYASYNPALSIYPEFPWSEALNVLNTTNLASTIDSH